MHKCKQIIELTSQNMDTSIPWYTRMELKVHYLMCKTCRRYAQQLQFISKAMAKLDAHQLTGSDCLSEDAKQRIAEKMHQFNLHKN